MDREEQFQRNNELFRIFMQEVFDNPSFSVVIPQDAEIIFLPENDPELKEANLALAQEGEAQGKKVLLVKVKLVPETKTVYVPKLELVKAK
ncbi:MAG: hypothetical protein HW384_119 [Dehalococcoidia bacterium]|nr:hypothetical protein [Dehalococcoidia bacterium]